MDTVIQPLTGALAITGSDVHFIIRKYPEILLDSARKFIEEGEPSIAVVACHIACEVATERAMAQAFTQRGLEHLREPMLNFLSGYSMGNERIRNLYAALTGDQVHQQGFWAEFKASCTRRNEIVHEGKVVSREEAGQSLRATEALVARLLGQCGT